jgi:hypothetical protein
MPQSLWVIGQAGASSLRSWDASLR